MRTYLNGTLENAGQKSLIGLAVGVFSFFLKNITELIVILVLVVLLDYATGIIAVYIKGEKFDKEKGLKGFVRKACYILIVALAFCGDYIIYYFTETIGYDLPLKGALGIAVIAYLIGTEGFSCTQNFIVIGLPVPPFLLNFFGLVKDQAGKIVKISESTKEVRENA